MHQQKLIRNGISATIPTASHHVNDRGVVDVDSRQILGEDTDAQQEIRIVNRFHLDSSNGLLAMILDLRMQLVPVLVPIVAVLGPHGFPWLVRRKPS